MPGLSSDQEKRFPSSERNVAHLGQAIFTSDSPTLEYIYKCASKVRDRIRSDGQSADFFDQIEVEIPMSDFCLPRLGSSMASHPCHRFLFVVFSSKANHCFGRPQTSS